MSEKPLVDGMYLLKKFPGKGGWTYAEIPEILQDKSKPFGWVVVKGSIDDHLLSQYKLMPMGNGKLFLPVKAAIRKKIKKQEGDSVYVVLYPDTDKVEIPDEIRECFANEPQEIYDTFISFSNGQQKAYIDWIYEAKKEETKIERIVKMMERLAEGKKFYDE